MCVGGCSEESATHIHIGRLSERACALAVAAKNLQLTSTLSVFLSGMCIGSCSEESATHIHVERHSEQHVCWQVQRRIATYIHVERLSERACALAGAAKNLQARRVYEIDRKASCLPLMQIFRFATRSLLKMTTHVKWELLLIPLDLDLDLRPNLNRYFLNLEVGGFNAVHFFSRETMIFQDAIALDDQPVEVRNFTVAGGP
jgi:hypothetical protein